ncbi:Uncharacterised protein [Pseudomonas putida]|jgi:hypothetical protein|nr:hypothetical protein SAMN05216307_2621 [Pseudomonas putida]SMQ00314.1 hypothetical protein SAMN05216380_1107 [Pseudomonas putida]VTQ37974.1 Uncharacterised protein [Pseudomonas putida]
MGPQILVGATPSFGILSCKLLEQIPVKNASVSTVWHRERCEAEKKPASSLLITTKVTLFGTSRCIQTNSKEPVKNGVPIYIVNGR